MSEIRTLLLDIETFSNTAYTWGLWDQTIGLNQLIEASRMICWVASWKGSDETIFSSEHLTSRKNMLRELHDLMDEADEIVTFNGDKFDLPIINKEFLLNGFAPPRPYKSVDLLKTVKKHFKFSSNKLQHIVEQLGIGSKIENEGFGLWVACNEGDDEAWEKMEEYNRMDVILLDELFGKLSPWASNMLNRSVVAGEEVCPHCGSKHFKKDGLRYLNAGTYQGYECKKCGGWFRGTKNINAGVQRFAW